MLRALVGYIGIILAGVSCLQAAKLQSSNPVPSPGSPYRAVLNQYCVTCHNEKLKTAGLMLDKMDLEKISTDAPVWEKVIRKLRTSAMPPAGMPRPEKTTYNSFATYLETELDNAAAAKPNPGRPAVHRLNRIEYTNAIRDLLSIDINGESLLPPDDSGYGFDNIGDVLTVSPMLLERYMAASRKISRLAVGDPAMRPAFETFNFPKILLQDERRSEDLPFGSRGGIAIRHYFPLDGEYVLRIRLQRNSYDDILGLTEPEQLDVLLDGARIKLFTVGGVQIRKAYEDQEAGMCASCSRSSAEPKADHEKEAYQRTADAGLEVRFQAKAGTHLVGVAFLKVASEPEGVFEPRVTAQHEKDDLLALSGVGSVTIGGPFNAKGPGETASRRKIFLCHPAGTSLDPKSDEQCARKILATLARRAYRRPTMGKDEQILLSFYKAGRANGDFESGIETALRGILVSPKFLFRVESDPGPHRGTSPNTAYRVSNLELASRLSFFLWSSIPDDELLDLAGRGNLKDSEVLERQVRRMLADTRSDALVKNFGGQWLYLRNMGKVSPDPEVFPDFDDGLREAFQRETELFLESNLREDRSILELLRANYTFVNERLARHYEIPNIHGTQFRRVTLSDERRGGLLGQGSILTVTSYANRTSPTLRGKWLLENILGTPPPPPPANVPSLKDDGKDGKLLSMRERMEQHRANPVCASCHSRMDPLGFAMENFDAIGKWRNLSEAHTPIDVSGVLPDGTKFQGPAELRKILLSDPEEFVTTVTEKLLTYALGRGVEYYDQPAIRKILREAASNDYRWSSVILGVVKSTPFQMRRPPEE